MDELVIDDYKELPALVAVNLPIFVRKPETGLELLGGKDSMMHSIRNNEPIVHLNLHPSAPARQCLEGKRQDCNDIVIRLKRKKGSVEPATIEVVGRITSQYTFTDTADFQFLTFGNAQMPGGRQILETVPRPFSKVESSIKINPEKQLFFEKDPTSSSAMKRDGVSAAANEQTDKGEVTGLSSLEILKFGDPIPGVTTSSFTPVDSDNVHVKTRMSWTRVEGVEMILTQLFEKIPVWSRRNLIIHPLLTGRAVIPALPRVCFCYRSGPFKGLLVRRGFDPAQNPSSRFLQTLSIRMNVEALKAIRLRLWKHLGSVAVSQCVNLDLLSVIPSTSATVATSTAGDSVVPKLSSMGAGRYIRIVLFGTTIETQFHVQFHQMPEDLFPHIKSLKRLDACDPMSGWYTSSQLSILRARILHRFYQRVQQFLSIPMPQSKLSASESAVYGTFLPYTSSSAVPSGEPLSNALGSKEHTYLPSKPEIVSEGDIDSANAARMQDMFERYMEVQDSVATSDDMADYDAALQHLSSRNLLVAHNKNSLRKSVRELLGADENTNSRKRSRQEPNKSGRPSRSTSRRVRPPAQSAISAFGRRGPVVLTCQTRRQPVQAVGSASNRRSSTKDDAQDITTNSASLIPDGPNSLLDASLAMELDNTADGSTLERIQSVPSLSISAECIDPLDNLQNVQSFPYFDEEFDSDNDNYNDDDDEEEEGMDGFDDQVKGSVNTQNRDRSCSNAIETEVMRFADEYQDMMKWVTASSEPGTIEDCDSGTSKQTDWLDQSHGFNDGSCDDDEDDDDNEEDIEDDEDAM